MPNPKRNRARAVNEKKTADLSFGMDNEIRVMCRLEGLFGVLKPTKPMDEFDFENEGFRIELKTRRVTMAKYDTTMVGENKVIKGFEHQIAGRRVFFVFDFVDCMCIWDHRELLCPEPTVPEGCGVNGTFSRDAGGLREDGLSSLLGARAVPYVLALDMAAVLELLLDGILLELLLDGILPLLPLHLLRRLLAERLGVLLLYL